VAQHSIARTWRKKLHQQLDPKALPVPRLSRLNQVLIGIILLSVLNTVLESEPTIADGHHQLFVGLDIGFGLLFTVEYFARLWVCVENPAYGHGWRGRWRYMRTPAALFDLLALMPLVFHIIGGEAYLFRLFRVIRVLRLAKLGRFFGAAHLLGQAIFMRRYELMVGAALALMLLLISSTLLYLVEGAAQPQAFGSIPRAMWWAIATLTTVGYGDVVPHTPLGKMLAGLTAMLGIGLIAVPTGILSAAFSDALQQQRKARDRVDEDISL